MPKSIDIERRRAVRRGLDFLYNFACEPYNFAECGSDLLNFFYLVATRAADVELRRAARRMGSERARHWRLDNPSIPENADAHALFNLLYGSDSADRLGFRDAALKNRLRRALRQFPINHYLCFDPVSEPPAGDVPDRCRCKHWNVRGMKKCRRCGRNLRMLNHYKVWYVALIRTYMAACYSVSLGVHYRHVLKWLPHMRPYRASLKPADPNFYETVFAVTHVVYTLSGYDARRLTPVWLPDEYEFLTKNFPVVLKSGNMEMVGEFLDTLKSLGADDADDLICAGTKHLLAWQNTDGSWGNTETGEVYRNYHATLCAVGGLLDYTWRRKGLSFPWLRPSLEKWARAGRVMTKDASR